MTTDRIRLWLDDRRPAPEGWTLVSTVEEAKVLLRTGMVTHASLDYDLGPGQLTGLDLVEWCTNTRPGRAWTPRRSTQAILSAASE